MIFKDRFNRKFFDESHSSIKLPYVQISEEEWFNRDTLPSILWLNGSIVWRNTKIKWHCITGPSKSRINGELVYQIDDVEMTKMEWLLAIEK